MRIVTAVVGESPPRHPAQPHVCGRDVPRAAPGRRRTNTRAHSANAATRVWNLVEVGENYGNFNLNQLDIRASKRFRFDRYRFRVDFDAYNIFNSNWPFTATNTFSTLASSQWLRPTNVLQARFFKIGAQFDF